jgi:hypothetical protein
MTIHDLAEYEILDEHRVEDVQSDGFILRHKKSGARIAILSNNDDNKVFYIGFRTPPEDETGVPHIIEHTTLCGSKKFPVKDPFIELAVARIAGIMGAKNNSMLIPLCHAIAMTKCDVEFELDEKNSSITAICTTACVGKTGVEMEAMTGVSVALLTIYDMCKALDRGMEIGQIHLLEKSGGKSGHYVTVHN